MTAAAVPVAARRSRRPTASEAIRIVLWAGPVAAGVALAFAAGGYFVTSWGVAGVLLLAAVGASALLAPARAWGGRTGLLALGGFGGLALWQWASGWWADEPSAAAAAANRTLLYGAAFALVLLGIRRATDVVGLARTVLVGIVVVTGTAAAGRLVPDLVTDDQGSRLSGPITYWNGLGALAAMGVVTAIGLAAHGRGGQGARAAAAACTPLLLLVLMLTYSRGAVIALVAGLLGLVALAGDRLGTAVVAAAGVATSIPLLLLANREPRVAAVAGLLPPDAGAGGRILAVLLVSSAGTAVVVVAVRRLTGALSAPVRQGVTRGALVACLLLAVAAGLASAPSGGPVAWAGDRLDEFQRYDPRARDAAGSLGERLGVAAGSGRWQGWSVAAEQFAENPLTGSGAGDYRFRWEEDRDIDVTFRNAHSLYLETLGESGLTGLALLLLPAAAVGVALARARRGSCAEGASGVAIAASGALVIGIHAAGDWHWQLPGVMLPGVALAAAALKGAVGERDGSGAGRRVAGGLVGIVAVLGIVAIGPPLASAVRTEDARGLAAGGDAGGALAAARDAGRIDPRSPEPRLLEANLLSDLGRPAQADAAFAAAAARSPRDWRIFADWSAVLLRRGDRRAAVVALGEARERNPRELRVRLLADALDAG